MPESHAARGTRRGRRQLTVLGEEVRTARMAAGLSLAMVARAAGVSIAELSRIERGLAPWLDVLAAVRVCSVVGLDLSVRAFPGSDPIRDAGHARLFEVFVGEVGRGLVVRAEVPIGDTRDLRAWDVVLDDGSAAAAVELETRLADAQALVRRLNLKARDGAMPTVVLALADTRPNRRAVRAAGPLLRTAFPLGSDAVLSALRSGRVPPAWGIVFIGSRPAGQDDSRGARADDQVRSPADRNSRRAEGS